MSALQIPRFVLFPLVLGSLAAAIVSGSAYARTKRIPGAKCAAAKRRLVAKHVAAITKCDVAAVARGLPVNPTCQANARTRFVDGWAKVEKAAGGACITSGDATKIQAIIAAHDADLEIAVGMNDVASKCSAGEVKAAGNADACELRCHAKAALAGFSVRQACLAACRARFNSACAKSEAKGDCRATGQCAAIASLVDTFAADAATALPSTPTTTSSSTTTLSSSTSTSSTSSTSMATTTTVASGSTTTTTMTTVACGTFVTKWGTLGSGDGQFNDPEFLAVDANGNVFVPDRGNNRIEKFTSDGVFVTKWGSAGSADGQFADPLSLAVDAAGNVFVADTSNNRIQKFTNDGTFVTAWGSAGSGDGQFSGPTGVATDANGNVFVADGFNNRMQKFTGAGVFLGKWGAVGSGDGQFANPLGVIGDESL